MTAMTRPRVTKMAGKWLWTCDHGQGPMGDCLDPADWPDAYSAVTALAIKHHERYHAELEEVDLDGPDDD